MTNPFEKLADLRALQDAPVLTEKFPRSGTTYTLRTALQRAGEETLAAQLAKALDIAEVQTAMVQTPILAVLGELNAGKSSVVASFLSPRGRARIPRGIANAQGTHRFVYWVPETWKQQTELRDSFRRFLQVVHGETVHELSDDPAEAAEQYRSGRDNSALIQIPLVAYDPGLDELQAAFLDCPDVQTLDRDQDSSDATNLRMEFVADAARLCSAFILLWERAKIRDRLLTEYLDKLRQRMPQVPLYLLVNKIRPERGQPTATLEDEDLQRIRTRFGVTGVFVAFDFDIERRGQEPGWRDLTPPALTESSPVPDERSRAETPVADRFPQFFAAESGRMDPLEVAPDKFLRQLPRKLDLADLQRQAVHDHVAEAIALTGTGLERVRSWSRLSNQRMRETHEGLLKFCVERFTNPADGEPYQIPETEFTRALSESFLRTAPWYLQPGLWIHGRFHSVAETVRDGTRRFQRTLRGLQNPFAQWRSGDRHVEEDLSRAGLAGTRIEDSATLAANMHAQRWVPSEVDEDRLREAWERILTEFSRFRLTIDHDRLDEMTSDFWNSLSQGQRVKAFLLLGVLTLMGSIAAVGGLLVAAVDGGATLFASYSLAAAVASAIPGLPAFGVAVVGTGGAFAGFMLGAVTQNTLPALSAFFSMTCHAFGIPERLDEEDSPLMVTFGRKNKKQFPLPKIDVPRFPPVSPLPSLGELAMGIWQWEEAVVNQYRKVIDGGA